MDTITSVSEPIQLLKETLQKHRLTGKEPSWSPLVLGDFVRTLSQLGEMLCKDTEVDFTTCGGTLGNSALLWIGIQIAGQIRLLKGEAQKLCDPNQGFTRYEILFKKSIAVSLALAAWSHIYKMMVPKLSQGESAQLMVTYNKLIDDEAKLIQFLHCRHRLLEEMQRTNTWDNWQGYPKRPKLLVP